MASIFIFTYLVNVFFFNQIRSWSYAVADLEGASSFRQKSMLPLGVCVFLHRLIWVCMGKGAAAPIGYFTLTFMGISFGKNGQNILAYSRF